MSSRPVPDAELYDRGCATLVASWAEFARGASGATVHQEPGVTAAVFPEGPERDVFNNCLVDRQLTADARAIAVAVMETAYASAGVTDFAAWVHETDHGTRGELEDRGYTVAESTRAMGLSLGNRQVPAPEVDLADADWADYLRVLGTPPGLLRGADPAAFHVLVACADEQNVATAMALDHDGDCGIYNVLTVEAARRRGLGTALTARHLHDAVARGCTTASLQSTYVAERVYAAVGFRDLGRILEYVPRAAETQPTS